MTEDEVAQMSMEPRERRPSMITSTDRVRHHRDRRNRGVVAVVQVELTEAAVYRLADEGYLDGGNGDEFRTSKKAISEALSVMMRDWSNG